MSKSIKFPDEHYIGFDARDQGKDEDKNFLPLAFATPNGTDKAAQKRRASVDGWVANNSTGYDYTTRTSYTKKQPKPVVLKNEPLAGFRLLDSIKRDSSWGAGNVKWRVEDPRGFELEISSPNLMQILACSVVDNGEILDMCMWAREGGDNVLVPVTSEVYTSAMVNTERAAKSASLRDVKIGDTVLMQNGLMGIYYGRMNAVEHDYSSDRGRPGASVDLHIKLNPKHLVVEHDTQTIHVIASPKLSEITPGTEIDKDAAETEIARLLNSGYTQQGGHWGGNHGFTFSKVKPTVQREKQEADWHTHHSVVFEVNGILYVSHYDYSKQNDFQAEPISKSAWENKTHVVSTMDRDRWGWNSRNFTKFTRTDLMARGIKCYKAATRITTDKGAVFVVTH